MNACYLKRERIMMETQRKWNEVFHEVRKTLNSVNAFQGINFIIRYTRWHVLYRIMHF